MTGVANVGGADVATGFAGGHGSIMTTDASTDDMTMIDGTRGDR